MTRKALLELIKYRLKPTDSVEQFPIRYIEGICDVTWASWCTNSANDKSQDLSFFTKLYLAVDVDLDSGSGYYSSTLPESILKLPRVGDGVMSVNQINSMDNDFKPISEKDFRLMRGQEVNRTGTDIYFYVTYDSVYYSESMDSSIASEGVDMRLSIPFSKYDLSEELPMPSGKEIEFVSAVVNLIQGTPPTDLINKNSNS